MNFRKQFVVVGMLLAVLFALAAGAAASLALATLTANPVFMAGGALLVMLLAGMLVFLLLSPFLKPARPFRLALGTGVLAVLLPVAFFSGLQLQDAFTPMPDRVPESLLQPLDEYTFQLDSVQPGSGFGDLEPVRAAVSGKRVVALGEATHGTAEFFTMKHRLVEFLVEEMGFRHFAMETHPETHGRQLDEYIQGRDVALEHILYWPWATEEYRDLLNWMREFNRGRTESDRIVFHGIDPMAGERDRAMADNVIEIFRNTGTREGVIVWAANSHIQGASGGMGEFLRASLPGETYLLGLEFHAGRFASRARAVFEFDIGPFPASYYSDALARLPGAIRFADFNTLAAHPVLEQWLNERRYSNHLFEMYALTRFFPAAVKVDTPLVQRFDGIIQVHESTPPTLMNHIR